MAKPYTPVFSHEDMLACYLQGLSDPEIASRVGCTASNVFKWRKKNNLPPNLPSHGGHGRPKRKKPEPPPKPEPKPQRVAVIKREMYRECRKCIYLMLLSNGMADVFCGYGLITGTPRITLPKREDGRCPGFAEGTPEWRKEADHD